MNCRWCECIPHRLQNLRHCCLISNTLTRQNSVRQWEFVVWKVWRAWSQPNHGANRAPVTVQPPNYVRFQNHAYKLPNVQLAKAPFSLGQPKRATPQEDPFVALPAVVQSMETLIRGTFRFSKGSRGAILRVMLIASLKPPL